MLTWQKIVRQKSLLKLLNKLLLDDWEKCGRCSSERKDHGASCPFDDEIRGVHTVCECCNNCQRECSDDI